MIDPAGPGRLLPDGTTRLSGDRSLIGGSPLRILRLTARGATKVQRWLASPADPAVAPRGALADRLVDTGMAHPDPACGSFDAGDVSVVIPVFAGRAALARTLAALHDHTPRLAEVVVVDDGSPDADDVARVASTFPSTRVLRLAANRGPAVARNAGLAEVTTPVVVFLDAGCEPLAGWLEPLLAHLADERVAVVAPRIVSARGGDSRRDAGAAPRIASARDEDAQRDAGAAAGSFRRTTARRRVEPRGAVLRYQDVRSSLDLGAEPAGVRARTRVSYVPAACLVARRDAVRAVDGFDGNLRVGEDVDLVWRLVSSGARVRYEPRSHVAHDHRSTLRTWARRRIDYGTSAAPLAARHPGALAPLGVSAWSVAAWALLAARRPRSALAVTATTTALLARKLETLEHPVREALRYGGLGHVYAGRSIAAALTGPWWPLLAAASLVSRGARRVAVAAVVVPALVEWVQVRPDLDPLRWVALRVVDDVAYGTGVWLGCIRAGTVAPLIPDLRRWPPRSD